MSNEQEQWATQIREIPNVFRPKNVRYLTDLSGPLLLLVKHTPSSVHFNDK